MIFPCPKITHLQPHVVVYAIIMKRLLIKGDVMQANPPNTPNQPQKRQLRLELPKDPSATYANTVMISHTSNEFIFDFIQIMPNDNRARVQKRIVMTPTHAKMFMNAITDNIAKFEEKNGEITLPQRQSLAEQLFGGIKTNNSDDDDEENDEES